MSAAGSTAARVVGAVVGTLPGAVLAGVALARCLPVSPDVGLAVGLFSVVPLWVAAMTYAFLARTATRVWVACGVAAGLMATVVRFVA